MYIHFLDKAIESSDQNYKVAQREKKTHISALQKKIATLKTELLQNGGKHKQFKKSRKQSKRNRKQSKKTRKN